MRFFIGFDIGDAESIIEMATSDGNDVFPATMPGQNASGRAIPTLYAFDDKGNTMFADQVAEDYDNLRQVEMNFKRRPSDLLHVSVVRANELMKIDNPQRLFKEPELRSGPLREFAEKLKTFVNIALGNKEFVERARAFAVNCEDCVISVGCPTNWDDLDRHIYRAMLLQSVIGQETYLGLPLTLQLERESRAAFLYIKNAYAVKLKDGEFVGLMDVGSSTIDISVLTKDSRTVVYDSGSNFLGARSIDYLILEYYISTISKDPEDGSLLRNVLEKNDAAFRSLLINCRFAKEKIFSAATDDKERIKARILFGDFDRVTLTWDTLVNDICAKRPIAPVLRKYCDLPEEDALRLGSKSWIEAFRDFLSDQIKSMKDNGIVLTKLFLTGSASRMEFVRTICKDLLPQLKQADSLFDDTNPSNAIANGLARVGLSDTMADAYEKDMEAFFDKGNGQLYSVIRHRIPDLIQDIADPIAGCVQNDIVIPAITRWKKGEYKTLAAMLNDIEASCKDTARFNAILTKNKEFSNAVQTWLEHKVGHDIALELQGIAHKHHVYNFTVDQLNAFKVLQISVGSGMLNGKNPKILTQVAADKIALALAAVVAVVSYMIVPFITGLVIGIVWIFFESLAISILSTMLANPALTVASFVTIAALLGVGVVRGYSQNKDQINDWLLKQNLPGVLRNRIKISDISEQLQQSRAEIVKKITGSINNPDAIKKLGESLYTSIQGQVKERADQIRYEIVKS